MASAPVCSAAILLLALALFASVSRASHPLTAVEAAGHAIITKEKTQLLSVHNDTDKEEAKPRGPQGSAAGKIRCLASAEGEGKKTGSYWGKAKKLDDDDDNDDSDQDSDSDHDHDHDSESDHDDHDSGSNSDHDHNHDHDSDSDHDHDSDSDDNDDDDDDDHNSKNERKKRAVQGRKGAPGGN
ncbi:unnamed protein product [Urochloa humidicola]